MRPVPRGLVRGLCSGFVVGVFAQWLLFRDGQWGRVLAFTFLSGLIWTMSEIRDELKREASAKSRLSPITDQTELEPGGVS
jgi:hypothetical protein